VVESLLHQEPVESDGVLVEIKTESKDAKMVEGHDGGDDSVSSELR